MEVHVVARRAVRRRLGVGERAEGRARALAHARGEAAGVEHARDVDETALDVRVLVAVALCVGVVGRAAVRMAVRMAVLVAVRVAVRVAVLVVVLVSLTGARGLRPLRRHRRLGRRRLHRTTPRRRERGRRLIAVHRDDADVIRCDAPFSAQHARNAQLPLAGDRFKGLQAALELLERASGVEHGSEEHVARHAAEGVDVSDAAATLDAPRLPRSRRRGRCVRHHTHEDFLTS